MEPDEIWEFFSFIREVALYEIYQTLIFHQEQSMTIVECAFLDLYGERLNYFRECAEFENRAR
jgi:hypothetical protein